MKDVGNSAKNIRLIRIFLPFILLLLGFSLFSLLANQNDVNGQSTIVASEAEIAAVSPTLEKTIHPTQENSTPTHITSDWTADVEITSTPYYSNFTPADIDIKGPPASSVFKLDSPITLYWTWPINYIEENYQFSVYLLDEMGEQLIGTKEKPSLGDHGYHLNIIPFEIVNSSGNYKIEIRLEQKDPLLIALRSNLVTITLE